MKIAIGATLHKKINKDSNGGTEMFAYILGSELGKKGHESTFFATSDSLIEGKLFPIAAEEEINKTEQNQRLFYGYQLLESSLITEKQDEFDVIHINYFEPFLFAPFSKLIKKPVVFTIHSDLLISPAWQSLMIKSLKRSDKLVFVSKSALSQASHLTNATYIYNGIDIGQFPYSDNHDDFLFWIGRVRRKKGIKEAVEAARMSQKKLILSGVVDSLEGKLFYKNEVESQVRSDNMIKFMGPADFNSKIKLYQKAKAFVFPVGWEEPFGLTIIEAMACGTPVIVFARGSIPEIVKDGVTGFIVNSSDNDVRGEYIVKKAGVDGLKEAIDRLYGLDPKEYKKMSEACRKSVENNFTSTIMANNYEKLYRETYQI